MNFELLFSGAFDTFKVFDDLSVDIAGQTAPGTPKNVWQILCHLITWQESQLLLLQGETAQRAITEIETWIKAGVPGQVEMDHAIAVFNAQTNAIKTLISELSVYQPDIEFKAQTILDMANHLAFHLGEIVLIRRQCKNYPMPEDMAGYLNG
jgi:hypothetical protein